MRYRIYAICFCLAVAAVTARVVYKPAAGSSELASTQQPQRQGNTRTWSFSGFLPSKPDQKVYVTVQGLQIANIGPARPQGIVVETNSFIFPGLMDMHNHVKYGVLPLWSLGKSQFLNRFEWRDKFAPYKDAVSYNMKAYKGAECAAVRWAEIKALAGGAVSIQGIGADTKCAAGYGVLNPEIPGDLAQSKIRALTDLVSPDFLSSVFVPRLEAPLKKRGNEFSTGSDEQRVQKIRQTYDDVLLGELRASGALAWMDLFANQPRSTALGVKLLIGLEMAPPPADNSPAAFDAQLPQIRQFLTTDKKLSGKALEQQIVNMRLWLYGKDGKTGYLMQKLPKAPLKDLDFIDDATTMDFVGKAGVLAIDSKLRRYLGQFESSTRRSVIKYYEGKGQAIFAHVAEGRRGDAYNKTEYMYATELGLVQPGLVMIHGVGLDDDALADAGRKKLSVVWSPFSNLLLYGETLDVVAARRAGLNVTLGPDWSPTGSKNMLDELKIVRRYLDKKKVPRTAISDEDIVDMATINAAKALGLDGSLGKVQRGYAANLLLIDRAALGDQKNPFTALVNAEQQNIALVVVNGEPMFGDVATMQDLQTSFGEKSGLELIPRDASACGFQKGLRLPGATALDSEAGKAGLDWHSAYGLEADLTNRLAIYKQDVQKREPSKVKNLVGLDKLFKCEDAAYAEEFTRYIEVSLDKNVRGREAMRSQYKLNNQWNPMKDAATVEMQSQSQAD